MEKTEYLARGTLGDCYIFCCKLKMMPPTPITVWHNTAHKYWIQELHDIYGLMPNVKPLFVDYIKNYMPELSSDVHDMDMAWFPNWNWPERHGYTDIVGDYMVIQPEAGKPKGYNHKELKHKMIYREVDQAGMPVVILGTSSKYSHIRCDHNLIGDTTVMDAMRLVSNAKKFIGPEGLLAFVALSHKVPSEIYFKSHQAVTVRIIDSPWEKYCHELAYVETF
jgi:hypothetical protein